jgi:hypothetical protein
MQMGPGAASSRILYKAVRIKGDTDGEALPMPRLKDGATAARYST